MHFHLLQHQGRDASAPRHEHVARTCGNSTPEVVFPHVLGTCSCLSTCQCMPLMAKARLQTNHTRRKGQGVPVPSPPTVGSLNASPKTTVPISTDASSLRLLLRESRWQLLAPSPHYQGHEMCPRRWGTPEQCFQDTFPGHCSQCLPTSWAHAHAVAHYGAHDLNGWSRGSIQTEASRRDANMYSATAEHGVRKDEPQSNSPKAGEAATAATHRQQLID